METLRNKANAIISSQISEHQTIREIENIECEYELIKSRQPRLLSTKPTIDEITAYKLALEKYETDKKYDDSIKEKIREFYNEKNRILKQYVIDQSGLDNIPKEYREKTMAYVSSEIGNDWYCVLLRLNRVLEIFY